VVGLVFGNIRLPAVLLASGSPAAAAGTNIAVSGGICLRNSRASAEPSSTISAATIRRIDPDGVIGVLWLLEVEAML
jgi:hypothetical protein